MIVGFCVARPLCAVATERAATKADRAGHDRIEPEHVLLALIEERGTVAKVLESFGVSADAVRRDLADSKS